MNAAIVQRELPLRIPLWIPTLTLAGARGSLGVSEDAILRMIEEGDISWSWNIATRGATRRELRLLAACLPAADGGPKPELKLDQVVRLVLGAKRPFIWGKHFYRAWNFDSQHLFNLIRDGSLQILSNHAAPKEAKDEAHVGWRRGPGGSPCITWNSAVEFLKTRKAGGIQ